MGSIMIRFYNWANYEMTDPRSMDLPLMMSPLSMIMLIIFYNYFVLSLGPRLMKNHKPFDLKKVIIAFDFLQILVNLWMFYKALSLGWMNGYYNWLCAELEWSDTPHNREIAQVIYCYFLTKLADLLDTVFFVLRKKEGQVSFLHLYHHSNMLAAGYSAAKWVPGGQHTFLGMVNCIVHAIMYFYYMISTINPQVRKASWKKLITKIQMTQFMMIAIHQALVFFQPNCNYPNWMSLVLVPQNIFMFLLFWDFYRRAYSNPEKEAQEFAQKAS